MKYEFYKKFIDTSKRTYFMVTCEDRVSILESLDFTSSNWQEIEKIIIQIEKNKSLSQEKDPYIWGNEDLTIFANEIGVLLVDKMALRAREEVEPLELTHSEMLKFLNDFKSFVEKNQ